MAPASIVAGEADPSLLDRFRRGDDAAFDEIVTRHRQAVYAMARRILARHEDADEAAQLVFIRAWKARARFRGESAMRTWLIRITLNVAARLRGAPRPLELRTPDNAVDPAPGAEERIRRRQLKQRMRRAVAQLPRRQREAVLLKVFSEMTYAEAARVMGLSEGAVKAHVNQAVRNLRRMLETGLAQEGT